MKPYGSRGYQIFRSVGSLLLVALVSGTVIVSLVLVVFVEQELMREPWMLNGTAHDWFELWREKRRSFSGKRRLLPSRDRYDDPPLYDAPGTVEGVRAAAGPGGGYPTTVPFVDVLRNWPYLDTVPPRRIYDTLRHFDWRSEADRTEAWKYRELEVPFVFDNVDSVLRASQRWSWRFLEERLAGNATYYSEWSEDPMLLYWTTKSPVIMPKGYLKPTIHAHVSFRDWFDSLGDGLPQTATAHGNGPGGKFNASWAHSYLHVDYPRDARHSGSGVADHVTDFVMDDLSEIFGGNRTVFMPNEGHKKSPRHEIYCLFGTVGSVAGIHYDNSNNAVATIKGQNRYILLPPNECPNLYFYPPMHPSNRHSSREFLDAINATESIDRALKEFPKFADARAVEVLMSPGQVDRFFFSPPFLSFPPCRTVNLLAAPAAFGRGGILRVVASAHTSAH